MLCVKVQQKASLYKNTFVGKQYFAKFEIET